MSAIASTVFQVVVFSHEGKLVTVDQLDFTRKGRMESNESVAHLFRLGGNSMYIKMYIIVPWKNLRIFPLLQGNGPFLKRNVRSPAWEN